MVALALKKDTFFILYTSQGDRLSTNYRPLYRSSVDRLSTAISTAMSSDRSVDTTYSKQDLSGSTESMVKESSVSYSRKRDAIVFPPF